MNDIENFDINSFKNISNKYKEFTDIESYFEHIISNHIFDIKNVKITQINYRVSMDVTIIIASLELYRGRCPINIETFNFYIQEYGDIFSIYEGGFYDTLLSGDDKKVIANKFLSRYNKLLRQYKLSLLTDIDLDI